MYKYTYMTNMNICILKHISTNNKFCTCANMRTQLHGTFHRISQSQSSLAWKGQMERPIVPSISIYAVPCKLIQRVLQTAFFQQTLDLMNDNKDIIRYNKDINGYHGGSTIPSKALPFEPCKGKPHSCALLFSHIPTLLHCQTLRP